MAILDALPIFIFILVALFFGLRNRKIGSHNTEEYFLAGRTLKGWQAGLSMAATQFSADTPLLCAGIVATTGMFPLWQIWVFGLSSLFLCFFVGPLWRRASVLTDAEFCSLRYGGKIGSWLRGIKAIYFGVIFNCITLAWILLATTMLSEPFLRWDQWLPEQVFLSLEELVRFWEIQFSSGSALQDLSDWKRSTNNLLSLGAILVLTLSYSATGGLRAVVATDIVQFVFMMAATGFYSFFVWLEISKTGGFRESFSSAYTSGFPGGLGFDEVTALDPFTSSASGIFLAVLAFQWLLHPSADGSGYLSQRLMACKSDSEARKASLWFSFTQVLLRNILWAPILVGLVMLFPVVESMSVASREASFILGIKEILPVGFRGLMVAAMLAALASTVDTHLNWGASYLTNDLLRPLLTVDDESSPTLERKLVWAARLFNFALLAVALYVATNLQSIKNAWNLALVAGAGVGPVLLLRWFWWRISAVSEFLAILVSFIGSVITFKVGIGPELAIMWVGLGGLLAAVAPTLFTNLLPEALAVARFQDRVNPAGIWPGGGNNDSNLNSIIGFLFCSATLFSALVGAIGLLVDAPAPEWWISERRAWHLSLIFMAMILVPVWVKCLRRIADV